MLMSRVIGAQELGGLSEARRGDSGTHVKDAADDTDNSIPPATYKFRLYSGKVWTYICWWGGPGIKFFLLN